MFISMAYRSTLLASLIAVELEDPITTWQQMLDHKMTLHIRKGVILNDIMKNSDTPFVR